MAEEVSLKEYLESKLETLEKLYDTKIDGINKATEIAREAMDKRLDGMNEFRDTLKDQASRFITRTEYEILREQTGRFISREEHNVICDDISELKESRAELKGMASQKSVNIAYIIATIGIILSIINLLTK